ncbi:unnamed protein product [Owenia fusiformis]|uniref:Uncharacterized protein n=1 Tax=Owenia fusiformis TaxID=6347 RepID=A0A8J1UAE8_OWEFU|nr:unnamed protein product [Owenia fusiformis]
MGLSDGELSDTKLHEAVRYGDIDDVKASLKDGLDPNKVGLYSWTCVHEAASNGDMDVLKLLLKHKGNPNKKDKLKGNTAVHYAAKEDNKECLEMLIQYGGRYNTKNNDGKTPLDVAQKNCEELLQKQRVKDLIKTTVKQAKEDSLEVEEKNWNKLQHVDNATEHSKPPGNNNENEPKDESKQEADKCATEKMPEKAWQKPKEKKETIMGFLQLSFEYNSRKSSLKVRVWQLSDILLPPADTSMIQSVYVKGYLLPDKKRVTKRKTDEVKIEKPEPPQVKVDSPKSTDNLPEFAIQTIFKPSMFKFSKPLEYKDITPEIVASKTVDLQVCITQKYTRKSFVIANMNLPLKSAVKKLVREKIPLRPCLSTGIPENMKVYSAHELSIISSARNFSSNPDIRNPSLANLTAQSSERASSDSDLKRVQVVKVSKAPSITLSLPPDEDDRGQSPLEEITILEELDPVTKQYLSKSTSNLVHMPGEISDEDLIDLPNISIEKVPNKIKKSKSTPDLSSTEDSDMSELENSLSKQHGTFAKAIAKGKKDVYSLIEKGKKMKAKTVGSTEVIELKDVKEPGNDILKFTTEEETQLGSPIRSPRSRHRRMRSKENSPNTSFAEVHTYATVHELDKTPVKASRRRHLPETPDSSPRKLEELQSTVVDFVKAIKSTPEPPPPIPSPNQPHPPNSPNPYRARTGDRVRAKTPSPRDTAATTNVSSISSMQSNETIEKTFHPKKLWDDHHTKSSTNNNSEQIQEIELKEEISHSEKQKLKQKYLKRAAKMQTLSSQQEKMNFLHRTILDSPSSAYEHSETLRDCTERAIEPYDAVPGGVNIDVPSVHSYPTTEL